MILPLTNGRNSVSGAKEKMLDFKHALHIADPEKVLINIFIILLRYCIIINYNTKLLDA